VFITGAKQRVPLVEQELFTLSEHLSSPPDVSGVRVAQSLVFCVGNTMGATSGAGTVYPFRAPEFTT
jgi:hypothetical protein